MLPLPLISRDQHDNSGGVQKPEIPHPRGSQPGRGRADNDRRRVHADGRGSHAEVSAALRHPGTPENRHLFSGLLCTIDLASDPVGVHDGPLEFAPPRVDFLLPHGNWTSPPPRRTADPAHTPYADWLRAVFDRWYGQRRQETEVRLFQEIMNLLLGAPAAVRPWAPVR